MTAISANDAIDQSLQKLVNRYTVGVSAPDISETLDDVGVS